MENCKHERLGWVKQLNMWEFHGYPIKHCTDCGVRLTPPQPEVMTLEEVAEDIGAWLKGTGARIAINNKVLQGWHRAITAHIEGEKEWWAHLEKSMRTHANQFGGVPGYSPLVDALQKYAAIIAARHTKGGKQ